MVWIIGNHFLISNNNTSTGNAPSAIPTMASIALKVAREDGTKLDFKQCVTYETICSTFLLQLVNAGQDDSTSIGSYFAHAAASTFSANSTSVEHDSSCGSISSNYSSSSNSTLSYESQTSSQSYSSSEHDSSCGSSFSECSSSTKSKFSDESQISSRSYSSSSNSSEQMKDNIDDFESFVSGSEHMETTCDSASLSSTDSTFTSHQDKEHHKDRVKDKLYALGAKEQLIMFLTGSAGAGKTTAVKLAQRFCYEFCQAVSILWNNRTFLFTAYTGSAASCFGGTTICKAAFLNKKSNIGPR